MVRLQVAPFVPLEQIRQEFDRVFKNFFEPQTRADGTASAHNGGYPALNFWEENDSLLVEAEVPGLKSDDLEIAVLGSELTLQGKLAEPKAEGTYHRRERARGEFKRAVRLPFDVAADKVRATLNDGVLLITLPKAAAAKPHKISVSTS